MVVLIAGVVPVVVNEAVWCGHAPVPYLVISCGLVPKVGTERLKTYIYC